MKERSSHLSRFFLSFLLLVLLPILLLYCQIKIDDDKEFVSFLPPRTAEVGEVFRVDEHNELFIQAFEVDRDAGFVIIRFDWFNDGPEAANLANTISVDLKQGGVSLRPKIDAVSDPNRLVAELAPSERLEGIELAYQLQNDSPSFIISWMGTSRFVFIDSVPVEAYPVTVHYDVSE